MSDPHRQHTDGDDAEPDDAVGDFGREGQADEGGDSDVEPPG